MNNPPMTAKEYLSRAYRIDQRINAKLEQAERLRELSRRRTVAYGGERVSHSRNVHRMEDGNNARSGTATAVHGCRSCRITAMVGRGFASDRHNDKQPSSCGEVVF